jgi:hypothetical protein
MSTKPVPTFDHHSLVPTCLFGPPGEGLRLTPPRVSPADKGSSNNKAGRQVDKAGQTTPPAHSRSLSIRHLEVEFRADIFV